MILSIIALNFCNASQVLQCRYMSKFDYQNELKRLMNSGELVSVRFRTSSDSFKAGYILEITPENLLLMEVDDVTKLDGVTLYRMSDITAVAIDTPYLREMKKQVPKDAIYPQVQLILRGLKKITFESFIELFEGTNQIVEIMTEDPNTWTGKIIAHDDSVVVLDEYDFGKVERSARSYIDLSQIGRMAIEIPYLKTISKIFENTNH